MQKQLQLFFIFLTMFTLSNVTVNAYAAKSSDPADDFGMKITGKSSQNEKTTFGKNEIPWLYVDLKNKDSRITGWWKPESSETKNNISRPLTVAECGTKTVWEPLTTWGWKTPTANGKYDVHINGYGTKSINIVPEPISAALFLIGGAGVALRTRLKNRKKI